MTGNEWSFWIYATKDGFSVGGLYQASQTNVDARFVIDGHVGHSIAGFHTHPYSGWTLPSQNDAYINRTTGTLGIIGTKQAIIAGRSKCH